jgi:hypothetical protein
MEERFHVGVVVHLASAVHALQHAEPGDLVAELPGGVFDATVTVEQHAGSRLAVAG